MSAEGDGPTARTERGPDPAGTPTPGGRRPRLLLLSALPPPTGGIPTWTLALLESDLARRFEVRVVNSSPSRADAVSGESRFRFDRALDALRTLSRWVLELVRFRPDVAHVNTPYYWAFLRDGAALWLASLAGAKTAIHPRGGDFPEFVAGARGALRRFVDATLRRADACIALTRDNQRLMGEIAGEARVRYVPNFVALGDLGPVPDRGARDPSAPVRVLFVGWMLEAKGVRELLHAARALPEARFVLIGAEDPDFLASVRDDLDALADRVLRIPPRPREEVLGLYGEADVFVLPTWREGFPNVVLEAMAAGLPVVATPVGAIPEAVRDGEEGFLVPVRDEAALTAALRRLVDDRELRLAMGRRARERAERVFSIEAVTGQLDALYRELMGSSR
jgi:glycosyltransferase involved in cell wall biosynthesis